MGVKGVGEAQVLGLDLCWGVFWVVGELIRNLNSVESAEEGRGKG